MRKNFVTSKPNFENELHPPWAKFLLLHFVTLEKRLCSISNKSAPQDIIPTSVLKYLLKTFPAMFTDAINCVLCSGDFPNELKHGMVMPLNKKSDEVNELKNYRPVTNIRSMAKLIEKAVLGQIEGHLLSNGLWPVHQSAYRGNLPTETSLIFCLEAIQKSIDEL